MKPLLAGFFMMGLFRMGVAIAAKDSCLECHTILEGNLQAPAKAFSADIHSRHGFRCNDCHGGDPNSDDLEISMSAARGFVGKPPRSAIPKLCARCHSDAALIHKFRPQQRVDQLAQYQTSVHGKKLAAGDEAVATCIDCHSVHDIRETKDPQSPTHPVRLPQTCARCHANAEHMAKYKIGTTQFTDYQTSVHWQALSKGNDLSAPNCATCHGNHGATPPQVTSVAAVCGTCHVVFEELFSKSPHQAAFADLGACVVCHSNHGIQRPSDKLLAGSSAICSQCHDKDSSGGKAAMEMASLIGNLDESVQRSDKILERSRSYGMEVSQALLRQTDAKENLVKARVAVHAFQVDAVRKRVSEGLAVTQETWNAGSAALRDRDHRRIGLAVSLTFILITLAGLWLAIRRIEVTEKAPSD
jgi:predicted CXXCH cytochrome family protein